MEKMHSLDSKLKYQIDRLLKLSEENLSKEDIQTGLLKPHLSSFLGGGGDDEEEDDEDSEVEGRRKKGSTKNQQSKGRASASSDEEDQDSISEGGEEPSDEEDDDGLYRPPKLSSTAYPSSSLNDKQKAKKLEKEIEKKRLKLKNSELLESLQEEFTDTPMMSSSSGLGKISGGLKQIEEDEAERIAFEEERFVRTTMTRKEKQSIKKRLREANKLDNFDDIGEYEDLEELSKMITETKKAGSGGSGGGDYDDYLPSSSSGAMKGITSTKALAKAMNIFQGNGDSAIGGKKKGFSMDLLAKEFGSSNHDEEEEEEGRNHKRRRAPAANEDFDGEGDDDNNGDDGGENMFDDYLSTKKQFKASKKEHYTVEPRYGGSTAADEIQDGKKRAISYEIMKNRGLTAHKKKSNRNPRVKKREAFEKATKARKGQVREVMKGKGHDNAYGGEMSGIKANLSRSRKM
jgi:hypothetical protein